MSYLMSKQQYLTDRDMSWHPHLMFFVQDDAAKSRSADQPGAPIIRGERPRNASHHISRLGGQLV